MERTVLEIIHDRHDEWVYMTMAFGGNKDTAEDLVQDMYLRMHRIILSGSNIMYNDQEVNSFYILKTLKSLFIDTVRKEKKFTAVDYSEINDILHSNESPNFDQSNDRVHRELKKLYWFDRQVFEIVTGGVKISDLSRKTTIPYYTLYNTYKKVYNHLKQFL